MQASATELERVFLGTRKLFHVLRATADHMHRDLEITAAMRAVMEMIARSGPQTVARMAKSRPVSRQHIQRIVNELLERGLARTEENIFHKRSPLIALTARGEAAFRTMRQREEKLFTRLAKHVGSRQSSAAAGTLEQLIDVLSRELPADSETEEE